MFEKNSCGELTKELRAGVGVCLEFFPVFEAFGLTEFSF